MPRWYLENEIRLLIEWLRAFCSYLPLHLQPKHYPLHYQRQSHLGCHCKGSAHWHLQEAEPWKLEKSCH